MGYKDLQGVTSGYKRLQGVQGVTRGYKSIQRVTTSLSAPEVKKFLPSGCYEVT